MAKSAFSLLFSLPLLLTVTQSFASPYLSPTILLRDYQRMLSSFRIYAYAPPQSSAVVTEVFTTQPEALFSDALLRSPFLTLDPNQADLFFVPFPPTLSTRSIARLVRSLRMDFPYWNRTLGADHFYLSAAGINSSFDRNVVELKKNSVQISRFPTTSGLFIPHKDITLPPMNPSPISLPVKGTAQFLGYANRRGAPESGFIDEMNGDPDFVVESGPSDYTGILIKSSKYCVFMYAGDVSWMAEAMASGCVPAVITDRPIQDLPSMDVIKWSEIGVFVGASGGAKGLKKLLKGIKDGEYEKMRELGVAASRHLVWNEEPQPYDAFHMVIYQLWSRRHTIRYARRE